MKTLLNYQLQNELSKANFNTAKRIYNRPPFMKVVYKPIDNLCRNKFKAEEIWKASDIYPSVRYLKDS